MKLTEEMNVESRKKAEVGHAERVEPEWHRRRGIEAGS